MNYGEIMEKKSISPVKFVSKVEKMNSSFKLGQTGDIKDFLIFILEQLHKELKNTVENNESNMKQSLNHYDKNSIQKYFLNEFKEECSIISDIFFGINETTNECLNCKNIYYNYEIFNCLIFPLGEVKKINNNSLIKNNIVSLYECFDCNQKNNLLQSKNQKQCDICKKTCDSLYTCGIFLSPNVLIFILTNDKNNICKLDFKEEIDIVKYVLKEDNPKLSYNLYGVITHIGQKDRNGHFIASCKNPIDKKWYRYDDYLVQPINNIQKEVIDYGIPYILFYQKA